MDTFEKQGKLGIIAGEGLLPKHLSINAMSQGYETIAIGINLKSFLDLQGHYSKGKCISGRDVQKCIDYLKENGVTELAFIGKIHKLWAITQIPFLDNLGKRYFRQMLNLQDNTLHQVISKAMEEQGFRIIPQAKFLENLLAKEGKYTEREFTESEIADIKYGFEMAKKASLLEVSQTVVVKNKAVMAFEAAEGTDRTIERGCKLARKNGVIVKVAWTNQSEKFDLPTIGTKTIETIAKYKGSALAIEANSTFIINPEETFKLANRYNIGLISINPTTYQDIS